MVKTAIDAEQLKADIMRQFEGRTTERAQDRDGEVCYNQRREERPKEGENGSLASKIL